jgi:hypothetical protein
VLLTKKIRSKGLEVHGRTTAKTFPPEGVSPGRPSDGPGLHFSLRNEDSSSRSLPRSLYGTMEPRAE